VKLRIPDSYDDDEIFLLERIVERLKSSYGHSNDKAVELVNSYLSKFTDQDFCLKHKIPVQTVDFFLHIEALGMADRIQFYEVLDNIPNENEFISWQRRVRGSNAI
jgi:hypothetical protein